MKLASFSPHFSPRCSRAPRAIETENLGLRGGHDARPLIVDGDASEWDLSGSVFVSKDVGQPRDALSL